MRENESFQPVLGGKPFAAIALLALLLLSLLPLIAFSPTAYAGPNVYVVAPGDTLTGIAERFGLDPVALARLNGLASPDYLRAGQTLILSGPGVQSVPQNKPKAGAQPANSYTVSPGDTLASIAMQYGADVEQLAAFNGLGNRDYLTPGQTLEVPGAWPIFGPVMGREISEPLRVPYRSQFDGTRYADGNCGPAVLGMIMAYFGKWWTTDDLRVNVNQSTGYWALDGGSDWPSVVYTIEKRAFSARGLYDAPKRYHKWTVDELMHEVRQGRPPMLLVRYRDLPEHEGSTWWGDHYIVFLGLDRAGAVVYHDPAVYNVADGAFRTMSLDKLERAWSNVSVGIQHSALSVELPGS